MIFSGSIFDNANNKLEHAQRFHSIKKLRIGSTPHTVIHRENKLRVLLYQSSAETKRDAILFVPSLINRPYILDLLPDRSLVRHFLNEGRDVALLDWGTPGDEDRSVPLERFVDGYMRRVVRAVEAATGTKKPSVLGYCLGGTFALLHERLNPGTFRSAIALTTPVDFNHEGLLSKWCRSPSFRADLIAQAHGNAPWFLLQSAFLCLKPAAQISKFATLFRRGVTNQGALDSQLALEIWANDNVAFPGRCFEEFIQKLVREDAMLSDFSLSPTREVKFQKLMMPVLNVMAEDDHIVPRKSSEAVSQIVVDGFFDAVEVKGGHIGGIVGRRASKELWPKLSSWLAEVETQRRERILTQ